MSKFTRREFLKTGGLALAGLTIAPSSILGKSHGHVPPSDRLNIAAVGIGGIILLYTIGAAGEGTREKLWGARII